MTSGDTDCYVAAIVAGDPEAFGQWASAVEDRLRGSLRSFARHADTEAIVQETLLRVWNVAPRFEPDGRPESLLRLASRIARNLAVSEMRRQRVATLPPEELDADVAMGHQAPPSDPHLRAILGRCRDKLPAKPSAALSARLDNAGHDPDRALALRLGMRLNTFLQNVTRARRLLARCLERNGVDLEMELS